MRREKQIEEKAIADMAKVIEITEQIARDAHCGLPSPTMYAKDLYWHGYRKQIVGEWIKTETNYTCSTCNFNVISWSGEYDGYECQRGISLMKFCPNCGASMKGGE